MNDDELVMPPHPAEDASLPPKQYHPPSIREWGTIAELTQAGGGTDIDGFGGSQPP